VETSRLKLHLRDGAEAERLLEATGFVEQWEQLHLRCPWSTIYQSRVFTHAWLAAYQHFQPVIVEGRTGDGILCGLFLLARDKNTGRVTIIGDGQGEYQIWLADPEANGWFAPAALDALARRYRLRSLRLQYVKSRIPLAGLEQHPHWSHRCWIDRDTRNFVPLHPGIKKEDFRAYSSFKQRLNKLGRMNLRCEQYTGAEELARILPQVALVNDFRHGSKSGVFPFLSDPCKAPFYLNLARIPGLLHAFFLWIDEELVSIEINLCDRGTVIHGMLAHRPEQSRNSVGRYHLLRLLELTAEQGYKVFDLTPAGDYKNDFGVETEDAYTLRIHFGWLKATGYRWMRQWLAGRTTDQKERMKQWLSRSREALDRIRRINLTSVPGAALRLLGSLLWHTQELRLYTWRASAPPPVSPGAIRINDLQHLLAYRPRRAWQPSRQGFLSAAWARMERGDRCFSSASDSTLEHYGWAGMRDRIDLPEVHQVQELDKPAMMLYDFVTSPEAQGKGLYQSNLRQMLSTILPELKPGTAVHIACLASNAASRHVIEKAGFILEGRYFERRRFRSVRRWREPA
jgi:CelD/BcsL family acetyltransferase involved in cellulose biosynthesis/RimJ/RimL family protein N-acetyltransferase